MAGTIFMIHGMCGGAWVWDNFRSFFEAQGYHCLAATLRFHDVDPQAAPLPQLGTIGLLDYAKDLETEIRGLGTPLILMGHSMGGLLAQMLGSRGLSKALVLLAPATPAGILCLKPTLVKRRCPYCGTEFSVKQALNKCPHCGGDLKLERD